MLVPFLFGLRLRSGIDFAGLDLNFVAVSDELGTEAKRFPLQDQVDDVHGLTRLIVAVAVRDLSGVKLQ